MDIKLDTGSRIPVGEPAGAVEAPSAQATEEELRMVAEPVVKTASTVKVAGFDDPKVAGRSDLLIKAIEDYVEAAEDLIQSQERGGPERGPDGLTTEESDKIALSAAKQRVYALVESMCGEEAPEAEAPAPEALPAPDPAFVSLNSSKATVKVAGFGNE